jgi:hypothetical protein
MILSERYFGVRNRLLKLFSNPAVDPARDLERVEPLVKSGCELWPWVKREVDEGFSSLSAIPNKDRH